MALGTLVYYSGIALCTQSFIPMMLVVGFGLFLFGCIKLVEEKELCLKFGDEYLAYKQRTPLLIPRLPVHIRKSNP
jgi:protein-S-isoprenylcysteine O-methyltransferase Ste14